jgi:hypothetical protein
MDILSAQMKAVNDTSCLVYLLLQFTNKSLPFESFLSMFLAIHRSSYYTFRGHFSRVRFGNETGGHDVYFAEDTPYTITYDKRLASHVEDDGWSIVAQGQTIEDFTYLPHSNVPHIVILEEVWWFDGSGGRYELIKSVSGTSKSDAVLQVPTFDLRILPKNADSLSSVSTTESLIDMALDILGRSVK